MNIEINQSNSLSISISKIVKNFDRQFYFVGTVLQQRFSKMDVLSHPPHEADKQTERMGNFTIANLVYYVTATPSRKVLRNCAENLKAGLHPILLIPLEQENKARVLAQDEGIYAQITILSIEGYIAANIIEWAISENKDLFSVLKEIIEIYNARLSAVETDLSLQIEVR